jgi:hypothetical protein
MKRAWIGLLLLFATRAALACSCVGSPTVQEELTRADTVFAGVVESIEVMEGMTRFGSSQRKVTFRVMQWWKTSSPVAERVQVWTGMGGGDCGYPVEEGQSYVVFAGRVAHDRLFFGICSRNASLVCASETLRELGPPIHTYEPVEMERLIAAEQPYSSSSRPCLQPAKLISPRGFTMDKHCRFVVDGTIGIDGTVRGFRIVSAPTLEGLCPPCLTDEIKAAVARWEFRPGLLNGRPVETRLQAISMREP